MKHFIYKTTHENGKYYIGRHSTDNMDDGYVGSGKWPRSIKDKTTLTREILEYAEDFDKLLQLEKSYLAENFGKPGCMNMTPSSVGTTKEFNPMNNPESVAKISGDNHWSRKNPEKCREKFAGDKHWMNKNPEAKKKFVENNPNLDGRNSKLATSRGRNIMQTNNPSKWRSEQGIHHWQNGNAPNANGELNKKLIAEGRHNLVGPEHNRRMIAEGKNPWVGSESNLKMLAEGRHPSQQKKTCEHCAKVVSIGMYGRWHGDKCKQNLIKMNK
jgi:hypothetical protein